MGHCIQGVVTRSAARLPPGWPAPVPLSQGFFIVPLFEAVLDTIEKKEGGVLPGFTFLDKGLSETLASASVASPLAYLETDYFGGDGCQGAVAYDRGSVIFGPANGDIGPISSALAQIGTVRGDAYDEFEALGLGRFRLMDDFAECEKFKRG